MRNKVIYLPGLNAIRAIAAIAVVVSHITLSLKDFGLNPYLLGAFPDGTPRFLDLAGYGVSMFFVLSGFLITYLLCIEKEKLLTVNIKKFYLRRIFRIWPLYYLYFAICVAVYHLFNIEFEFKSIKYYLFYSANIPFIVGGALPLLSHYWSLAVEEQFYMFWPWLNKLKLKSTLIISITCITILICTRVYLHFFIPNTIVEKAINVTRFHCMLIGAVTAILYYQKNEFFLQFTTNKIVQFLSWLVLFFVAINKFHIVNVLDTEIVTGVTAIIIMGQVTKKGLISLENKLFDFLGKISYGIYVIHPLLIFIFAKVWYNFSGFTVLNYVIVYSTILLVTIGFAYLSYEYFEKPFLKIKESQFSVIKSSGHRITSEK